MGASTFLITTPFWCKILIVSSCFSHSSAAINVKVSNGDRIWINFKMMNMGQATGYKLFDLYKKNRALNLIESNKIRTTYGYVIVEYRKIQPIPDFQIILQLYINSYKCNTRAFDLVQEHYTEAESINYQWLPAEPYVRNIVVDWGNECVEPPSGKPAPREISERNEYITILKERRGYNGNQTLSYNEGDNVTITCQTNYESYFMIWTQQKDDHNVIMKVTGNVNTFSSINMIISRFDDGTMFRCFLYILYKTNSNYYDILDISGYIHIKVKYEKNTQLYETTMATHKEIVSYYDFKNLICSGILFKRWIKLTKEGFVERLLLKGVRVVGENLSLSLQLNETDTGTEYMCLGVSSFIKDTRHYYYKREIASLVYLVYNTTEHRSDILLLTNKNITFIAGVVGVVAVILLLVVIICICSRKSKPRRPAPHEVETYACPTTVQYVDLQMTSSNSRRCVNTDDTPYARIIGVLEPTGR